MGQVGDLIGAQGAAAAGMLGPAEHPGLEESAVDNQLATALEQVEQANLALGPLECVRLSTTIQGIRRRSAASASRDRVKAFSFSRSCSRTASHSCCDTIEGMFVARCPFSCSLFLSLLVAILFLLC